MMQHPPPPDGIRINDQEHAARMERYRQRIALALERYAELKRRKEATK